MFYLKDQATDFSASIANDNNFKSFIYKAKLLQNIATQAAINNVNRILKNATIVIKIFKSYLEIT